jgi:prolyl-tRNA synthetase
MRWSQILIPTSKQPPADAPSPGHALLARAGMVQLARGGGISYLPLGLAALRKLAELTRESIGELGCQEVLIEGDATAIAGATIRSYKQLPLNLYQIAHPPGPVLTTSGFHANPISRQKGAEALRTAVSGLLKNLKVPVVGVTTVDGAALAVISPAGTSSLMTTDAGDYVATPEAAEVAPRPFNFAGEPADPPEKIATPGLTTVAAVCAFLGITPQQILKTLVFSAQSPIAVRWVVAVVRGDHLVNLRKLREAATAMGVTSLRLADAEEATDTWSIGFVGPDAAMKLPDAVLIVDPDAAQGEVAWAAGGNENDAHVRNFNWFRECGDRLADPVKVAVADIRNAVDGDKSPTGAVLHPKAASILFEQLMLPTDARLAFDDLDGEHRPLSLSTNRLDLGRVLLGTAEFSHDEHGLLWPPAIAPCAVVITAVQYEGSVRDAADAIYTRLVFDGADVILDDRDLRAGPKFADADLVGFPVRVTIGPKTVEQGQAEIKPRSSAQTELVPLANVPARVAQMLMDL